MTGKEKQAAVVAKASVFAKATPRQDAGPGKRFRLQAVGTTGSKLIAFSLNSFSLLSIPLLGFFKPENEMINEVSTLPYPDMLTISKVF